MAELHEKPAEQINRHLEEMVFAAPKSTIASAVSMAIMANALLLRGSNVLLTMIALLALSLNLTRVGIVLLYWSRRSRGLSGLSKACWRMLFVSGLLYSPVMAALAIIAFSSNNIIEIAIAAATVAGYVAGVVIRASAAPRLAISHILLFFLPLGVAAVCVAGSLSLAGLLLVFCFSCVDLSKSVHSRMRQQLVAEQKLALAARTDYLTGLANRVALYELGLKRLQHTPPLEGSSIVAMIDLDGFKNVNDIYGHGVGDEILKSIGTRLRRCLRGAHFAARLGGDEFALVFDTGTTQVAACSIGREVLDAISFPCDVDGVTIRVSASIGIATSSAIASDFPSLLKLADNSLYLAKKSGKNRMSIDGFPSPSIVPTMSSAVEADAT